MRRLHWPEVWIISDKICVDGRQPSFQVSLIRQQPHRAIEAVPSHHRGPVGESQVAANHSLFPCVERQQSDRWVCVAIEALCEFGGNFPPKPDSCPQGPSKL